MRNNSGIITCDNLKKIAIEILDIFEDYLESKDVVIENNEKQDAINSGEDAENLCVLYGSDYGDLQGEIICALMEFASQI